MREIFLREDPIPVGSRVGDLIHGLRIAAPDTAAALADLRTVVEAAGASLDNVAQVSFFVAHRDLLASINPAWLTVFTDDTDRPTYKFMTAALPPDKPIHVEFFAVANQRRRLLHLPNVAHTNPIPMGVRIGRYLFSSRVLPYDPQTGQLPDSAVRQAECVFENVRALLAAGDCAPAHITQARLFLADPADRQTAERLWRGLIQTDERPPAPQVTHYTLAPSLKVMLEFIAAT
ncbi:MAG TPA: Rid family hydrolase [Chloroflexota bacterium]|jgi:enamine deaminase RidA (YjgF/YER057c/UK114 family)|nr:Rid family hydrolase [Chloroflexota bacterium]